METKRAEDPKRDELKKSKRKDDESSEDEEEEDEFNVVEKIVNRRSREGKVEYLVKWENTWAPEERLECGELIAAFEAERARNEQKEVDDAQADSGDTPHNFKSETEEGTEKEGRNGFARGLEPVEILGASDASGERMFLMQPRIYDFFEPGQNVDSVTPSLQCLRKTVKTANDLAPP